MSKQCSKRKSEERADRGNLKRLDFQNSQSTKDDVWKAVHSNSTTIGRVKPTERPRQIFSHAALSPSVELEFSVKDGCVQRGGMGSFG